MAQQIFISFPADGGKALAKFLTNRLTAQRYSVVCDLETAHSPKADPGAYAQIDASDTVIVILPQRALDRCMSEGDRMREEISRAVQKKKNVIPVVMAGFRFPKNLPEHVEIISRCTTFPFEQSDFMDFEYKEEKLIDRIENPLPLPKPLPKEPPKPKEPDVAAPPPAPKPPKAPKAPKSEPKKEAAPAPAPAPAPTPAPAPAPTPAPTPAPAPAPQKTCVIREVHAIGTLNREEAFPQGNYSTVFPLSSTNVIRFHIDLTEPVGIKRVIPITMQIYNSANSLVLNHSTTIDAEATSDRFSLGWIINSVSGTKVAADNYRADFTVEGSPVSSLHFRVDSSVGNPTLPNLIKSVQTIGTLDRNNSWPSGSYSYTISLKAANVVRFHVNLYNPIGVEKAVPITMKIYNSTGKIVLNHNTTIDSKANYDRYSLGWIINGTDGSKVDVGRYRAEFTVNGSAPYSCSFTIESGTTTSTYTPSTPRVTPKPTPKIPDARSQARIDELTRKLSRTKGFRNYFFMILCLSFGIVNLVDVVNETASPMGVLLMLGGLVAGFVFFVKLVSYTQRMVTNNGFLTFLVCFILLAYYGIYLFFTAINALIHKSEWKREIEMLKR